MKKRSKKILEATAVAVMTIIILVYVFITHDWLTDTSQRGEYNTDGLGDEFVTYSIKDSDKVVYSSNNGIYLLGDRSESNKGTSYFSLWLDEDTFRDPILKKVSSEYLVFSVRSNSVNYEREMIAVEVEEKWANFDDRIVHLSYPYDELSWWEKFKMHDVYE